MLGQQSPFPIKHYRKFYSKLLDRLGLLFVYNIFPVTSVAVTENPRSLQNIIWVGLHWYQFNKEMRPGGMYKNNNSYNVIKLN